MAVTAAVTAAEAAAKIGKSEVAAATEMFGEQPTFKMLKVKPSLWVIHA